METDRDLISVIMPVYNAEATVEKAALSILGQDHKKIELLIVDDGSDDKSPDICCKLADEYENVIYILKENGGPASARNRGLKAASGRFIGFIDADDEAAEDMYESLLSYIQRYETDIAVCGYVRGPAWRKAPRSSDKGKEGIKLYRGAAEGLSLLTDLGQGCSWSLWNKLYRRELIADLAFDETIRMNEDLLFNLCAFGKAKSVCYTGSRLYRYDDSKESLSRDVSKARFIYVLEGLKKGLCYLESLEGDIAKAKTALRAELLNQLLMAAEAALFLGDEEGLRVLRTEILTKKSAEAEKLLKTYQRMLVGAMTVSMGFYKLICYMQLPLKLALGGGDIYKACKKTESKIERPS